MLRSISVSGASVPSLLLHCVVGVGATAAVAACGEDAPITPMGGDGGVSAPAFSYTLGPRPLAFGAIPWPDDLYLSAEGTIDVAAIPGVENGGDERYLESLRGSLGELDGFGVNSPVFFPIVTRIDPASLPDPAGSEADAAAAFLIDVDPASATAFERVRARFHVSDGYLAMRPDDGHPLRPGGRYAAVVTSRVRTMAGAAVGPDPDFAAIRDATTRPTDTPRADAYDIMRPVLDNLATRGVARADVAALSVFRVQTVSDVLEDARDLIATLPASDVVNADAFSGVDLDAVLGRPRPPVAGVDVDGGVAHDGIRFMIHGEFEAPWFVSDSDGGHGRFQRDASGNLVVRRQDVVTFSLFVPHAADISRLRLVIVQHGLGTERSDALGIADALALRGYAVLAMDLPYSGMRASDPGDVRNRFTDAMTPDRFADVASASVVISFSGIFDLTSELIAFSPVYLREALRQSVCDLMSLVRLVRDGNWARVRGLDPDLASLGFDDAPIAFIGHSLGGIIGTMFAATEPKIGAAVLGVTGGHIMRTVLTSPPLNLGYIPQLLPSLGRRTEEIDYDAHDPIWYPELALWQTLLDRGDSMSYTRALAARRVDILMLMSRHDEFVNNISTEALARAIGLPSASAPAHTDLEAITLPVRGNQMADGGPVTRALQAYEPAGHGLFLYRGNPVRYEHPVAAPFAELPAEQTIMNPTDESIGQIVNFIETWRSGAAEIAPPPS